MKSRLPIFLVLSFATAATLSAQEKKPAPPKVPAHSPEQSKLNQAKRDNRNVEDLKKAGKRILQSVKSNDAAKREIERAEKEKPKVPAGAEAEARAKFEKLKTSVDPNDVKELEELLKNSSGPLREELKKLREQKLKEPAPAPSPNPETEAPAAPGSFDNIAPPEPIPLQKAPVFTPAPIRADHGVRGPARDPKNPDKMLPASDPRPRTWLLDGNVRFRQPTMAMDADEVEVLFKEGESPDGMSEKKKPEAPPSPDPVNRSATGMDSSIERIVARGRVRIMIVDDNGRVQVGRGGHMIYDAKTGSFLLKDWPEAEVGNRLLKGISKNAVIRLGRLEDADITGLDVLTLEKELKPEDLPKTPDKPVPGAGAVLPKPSAAPPPSSQPR